MKIDENRNKNGVDKYLETMNNAFASDEMTKIKSQSNERMKYVVFVFIFILSFHEIVFC